MIDKISPWMRIILPILVTMMLFTLNDIKDGQEKLCTEFDHIKNNLYTEVTEIKVRLKAIETFLKGGI